MNFKQIVDYVVDNGNLCIFKDSDFFTIEFNFGSQATVSAQVRLWRNRTQMRLAFFNYGKYPFTAVCFFDTDYETSTPEEITHIVDMINKSGVLND